MQPTTESASHGIRDLATGPLGHHPFRQTAYLAGHPTDECPACGSGEMCWVTDGEDQSNYVCEACGRCWTVSSVGVVRVNPVVCPGCGHREACFEQLRQDIPPWGWLPADQ